MPPAGPTKGRGEDQRSKLSPAYHKHDVRQTEDTGDWKEIYYLPSVPCVGDICGSLFKRSRVLTSADTSVLTVKNSHQSAISMVRRWNRALKRKAHYEMQPDLIFNMMADPLTHSLLVFAFRRNDSSCGRNQNNTLQYFEMGSSLLKVSWNRIFYNLQVVAGETEYKTRSLLKCSG